MKRSSHRETFSAEPRAGLQDDYETMSPEALKALQALQVPGDPEGCVLYMWAINPDLPLALEVMAAWDSDTGPTLPGTKK